MDFKGIVYSYLRYLNNSLPATASPRAETARYPAKQSRRQCHPAGGDRPLSDEAAVPERGQSSGRGIINGAPATATPRAEDRPLSAEAAAQGLRPVLRARNQKRRKKNPGAGALRDFDMGKCGD